MLGSPYRETPVMSHALERFIGREVKKRRAAKRAHAPSRFELRRAHGETVRLARELVRDPRQVESVDPRLRGLLDRPEVLAAIERDETPIPATKDREGYFDDRHLSYWLSGFDDLQIVQRLTPGCSLKRVLDFGGASGRFARHVALADERARVTIAELDVNHVAWVDKHFGASVRSVKVSPYPHFPLADGSVSLCVGLSVFTHIDSYESGWLAEINRVLEPGGYAFLTVHNEDTWEVLPNVPHLLGLLNGCELFRDLYRGGAPMPEGRHVFDYNYRSIEYNCNVFMHSDHIRRSWGKWFEVVGVYPRAHHDFQTAVVLRKE